MAGNDYYCAVTTVTAGAPQVTIDLVPEILAKATARHRFIQIRSDKDLTVRFNESTADAIAMDVSVNPELTIQHAPIHTAKIYLSTVGGCGTGDATVQVLVM